MKSQLPCDRGRPSGGSRDRPGGRGGRLKAGLQPVSRRAERCRASVLVAVLAVIMILGYLVTRFMEEAAEDLEYRAIFSADEDFRAYAYSLLEASLAAIAEIAEIDEGSLYAPEQGWGDPLAYAGIPVPNGWEASVQVNDESSRFPLSRMDESTLNELFEEMGFDFSTTRELSSCLLDWTDADDSPRLNGAESDTYLDRDPPYRAANAPLQTLEELRLIEQFDELFFDPETGQPNEYFQTFSSAVSLINDGPVNVNSAPPIVLRVLGLLGGFEEDRMFDGLFDEPYLKELPESVDTQLAGTEVSLLSVVVTLKRGDVPYTIYALVRPAGSSGGGGSQAAREGRNLPGQRSADETVRTGTDAEQQALDYPFTIIRLSEHQGNQDTVPAARYSMVDIAGGDGGI